MTMKTQLLNEEQHSKKPTDGEYEGGGALDPLTVGELKAALNEYSKLIKRKRGVGKTFYSLPRIHNMNEEPHVNWANVFFDLTYVGVAFKIGNLIIDVLDQGRYAIGFLYVASAFLIMYDCWELKMNYDSRFNSRDVSHKMLDITGACIVVLVALNLPSTLAELEDVNSGYAIGFTASKIAYQVLQLLLHTELILGNPRVSQTSKMAQGICVDLLITLVPLFSALFLLLGAPGMADALLLVSLLWLLSFSISVVDFFLRLCWKSKAREDVVPMHVDFVLHRFGEWNMLMLGEGVLQIILIPMIPTAEHYLLVIPSYLLIALIQILYYSSQPWISEGHCLKRSFARGYIWLQLQPIESLMMISMGVSVKLIIKQQLFVGEINYEKYAYLLCTSVAGLLLVLWFGGLLHHGFHEEFMDMPQRYRTLNLVLYLVKVGLSLGLLVLPLLHLDSWSLIWICVLDVLLQIVLNVFWASVAKKLDFISDQEIKSNVDLDASHENKFVSDSQLHDLYQSIAASYDEGNRLFGRSGRKLRQAADRKLLNASKLLFLQSGNEDTPLSQIQRQFIDIYRTKNKAAVMSEFNKLNQLARDGSSRMVLQVDEEKDRHGCCYTCCHRSSCR